MLIITEVLELETTDKVEIIDITGNINTAIAESGIRKGLVNIYSKHSTSGIFINENESGLLEDFKDIIHLIVPTNGNYQHNRIDNNADSHLRSFLIGCNETIPLEDAKLSLGTWQSVFFLEFDGPRTREITITIIGE
ncbi:MAG: secondary thiamine-phosphate synthase enzyme YjbQ [Methanobacterium sp.]